MCYRIAVAAHSVFILGIASLAAAEDVTAKGQVSITFTVPYQELLQGEFRPNSTIELTNNSLDTLHYIPEGSWADVLQIFIKVDRTICIPREHRNAMYDPDIETYGLWERVREFASAELKPGESVAWQATNIPYPCFALSPSRKPKSIQAQVLIGPAQWVSSKPVPIKFMNQGLKECPVVFENDYLTGPQRAKSPIAVYRVAIQNKEFLFTSSCFRICEIPKDSKPDFTWEPRLGLLKIDYRIDQVPLVWFYYPMLERLDSDKSRTEFYRQKYNFEYGDADYRERALKGMASHGTAASVQLFDEYGGSNELLLQHRERYECMRLLLDRAGKMEDVEQSRQLIRQTLFADELQLASEEKIALPPLSEAQKAADFLAEFVENTGRAVLTLEDLAKITTFISHIKETAGQK
ncbi:MAG: hypothetical protein IH624_03635 [Phycisphaerae bacterium]|nr:hypothetical protein [Phycisphaerae bacterium]